MAEITAQLVKQLRDITSVGFGECKKALTKAEGDIDAAVKLLREEGQAKAIKRGDRAANQGLVSVSITDDLQSGALIEVNCETDFVAKNDDFGAFVDGLAKQGLEVGDGELSETVKEEIGVQVIALGENLVVSNNIRYTIEGTGAVTSYIHNGGQVGVLMELGFDKADSVSSAAVLELGRDLCMHVAALAPQAISRDEVDPAIVAAEREIFAKQVEGKPAEIIDKIVDGKINKFYSQICMLEQGFVKDPDQTVSQLIEAKSKEVGDKIVLRRCQRFQIGA
jgi:elongation factor Ts